MRPALPFIAKQLAREQEVFDREDEGLHNPALIKLFQPGCLMPIPEDGFPELPMLRRRQRRQRLDEELLQSCAQFHIAVDLARQVLLESLKQFVPGGPAEGIPVFKLVIHRPPRQPGMTGHPANRKTPTAMPFYQ